MNSRTLAAALIVGRVTTACYSGDVYIEPTTSASGSSNTTIVREIVNAESAAACGVQVAAPKALAFPGGAFDTIVLQGNFTLQNSELVAGTKKAPS